MTYLLHLIQFFFIGHHSLWYEAAVWGNVFVIFVLAPLGYLWSKFKFWPLKPLEHEMARAHDRLDGIEASHAELHEHIAALMDKHDKLLQSHEELKQMIKDQHGHL